MRELRGGGGGESGPVIRKGGKRKERGLREKREQERKGRRERREKGNKEERLDTQESLAVYKKNMAKNHDILDTQE